MAGKCVKCGSYAINHHSHGRDGSDPDLCDVCFWRKRAEKAEQNTARLASAVAQPDLTALCEWSAMDERDGHCCYGGMKTRLDCASCGRWVQLGAAPAAQEPTDPCPTCPKGSFCRTPKCGRLAQAQAKK